jgi:hypothetical protein
MSIIRKLSVAARRSELPWRYGFNLAPSLAWRTQAGQATGETKRVLTDLNRDGIALTSARALLGPQSLYQDLRSTVARMEEERAMELAAYRNTADDTSSLGSKTFIYQLLGERPVLDENSVFARFALQTKILDIVNAYFGMFTRLREYNVWHTFVTSVAARESQLWHRDREDRLILKVFVYLNDVDEGAGPFTYAPGTHAKGTIRQAPEAFNENGVWRSVDEQMARVVPQERWIKAVGPEGTIIFADTHGYHKGGHARLRDRLMYTSLFTSPASESRELMERRHPAPVFPDLARTIALSPPRGRLWLSLPQTGSR